MGYFDTYYNMFLYGGMPMNVSVPPQYITAIPPSFSQHTAPISFGMRTLPAVKSPVAAAPMPQSQGHSVLPNVRSLASAIASRIVQSVTSSLSSARSFGSSLVSTVSHGISSAVESISNFGQSMVAKARSFLGYNERNGSYKLFTQGRTEAWCADFVSYVARQCGKTGFNFPSVQGILNWGKRNNRFSTTAKVGDAIIFKGAGASHTGIVTRVANGRVYTIEGNTSDKVAERSYSLSNRKITGFVTIA